jgi:rod shape determining protein RodA
MAKSGTPEINFDDRKPQTTDWKTLLITFGLLAIGLLSIFSSTNSPGMGIFFERQLVYVVVGLAMMFTIMYIPEHWLQVYSMPFYLLNIFLLVFVLQFGTSVYGTRGWLSFAGISIQPGEIAKLGVIVMLARHLSYKGRQINNYRDLAIVLVYVIIPAFLVLREPDFGSMTVIFAVLLGILLWAGFDLFILYFIVSIPVVFILSLMGAQYYFVYTTIFAGTAIFFRRRIILTVAAIGIIIAVGYASIFIYDKMPPHQKKRIDVFLSPGLDPQGAGYNVIQSIYAVGNGQIAGRGFLEGTQTQLRYIPKQWTDFIFSVPAEEFGFVGGITVIGLLVLLMMRAIAIAQETRSKFLSIICIGGASLLFYHTMINIGMAIGLMPVMGIPLPFISSGGSSLVVNMVIVGFMLNAYRQHRRPRE